MREWLNWREEGLSEVAIRDKATRDLRTVRKGIAWAVEDRRSNLALLDLLKDALRDHQNQLKGAINEILAGTEPVKRDTFVEWHKEPQDTESAEPEFESPLTPRDLLREHLPKDPVWNRLEEFEELKYDYLDSLASFKKAAADKLVTATGGVFVDGNFRMNDPKKIVPEKLIKLVEPNLLERAYQITIKKVFEPGSESVDFEERLKLFKDQGEVRWGEASVVAVCRGGEESCRSRILSVLSKLPSMAEAKKLPGKFNSLMTSRSKVVNALSEIKLGLFISGECRVCRRLKGSGGRP